MMGDLFCLLIGNGTKCGLLMPRILIMSLAVRVLYYCLFAVLPADWPNHTLAECYLLPLSLHSAGGLLTPNIRRLASGFGICLGKGDWTSKDIGICLFMLMLLSKEAPLCACDVDQPLFATD
jgi:hypothetical protein